MLEKLKSLHLVEPIAVVGLGVSGRSSVKFLREAGYAVSGLDERHPDSDRLVSFDNPEACAGFATLVISPGVDRRKAAIRHSTAEKINDIELFARLVERPVLAVTGSNGKSTVVSMLAHVYDTLGKRARLCGNIGRPVLEALFDEPEQTEVYVVELSSYQLEICPSLEADVGAVINVSPDHLDRYDSYADYIDAKANLARQSVRCVLNHQDSACREMANLADKVVFFGPECANRVENEQLWISGEKILDGNALQVHGRHNLDNALVCLTMLACAGETLAACAEGLKSFQQTLSEYLLSLLLLGT